jgi:hypothetical protein
LVYRVAKRRREQAEAQRNESGDSGETFTRGSSGTGEVAGLKYSYRHYKGSDKSPPYFMISIACDASGSFKFKKETKFDRFFKRLGVCIEIQTNDPEFDDRFYITSETIPFTRSAVERRDVRRSILEMFKLGFNSLYLKNRILNLTWHGFPRRKEMQIAVVEAAVAQMAVMVEILPTIYVPEDMEKSNWKLKRFIGFAVPSFLLISGIVLLIMGHVNYNPLDSGKIFVSSLMYSLPLFVMFSWLTLEMIKGRSTSHHELIAIVLLGLFAFPMGGYAYTTYLNGALDDSPESVYDTRMIRKYSKRNKNSYSYYMVVTSWRETEKIEKIKVSHSFYNRLRTNARVTVTTKPGKFGFEWIVGFR